MPATDAKRSPRRFKSAEKPVSLHPLSFKEAVTALLKIGPLEPDEPAKGDRSPGSQVSTDGDRVDLDRDG